MAVDTTDLTTYPVPSSNAFVFQRNASDADLLMNGASETYTNRAGNEMKSAQAITNLYDQFQASFMALQSQFETDFQNSLDEFNAESDAAISDFNAESDATISDFNSEADLALARIAAFDNTGEWAPSTNYTANQLWQNPADLTWYFVLENYTSDASDINVDIASGNVAVFAGATYNYSYVFINDVLGDKITYGSDFDDADAYDAMLGKVHDGTATAQEIAISSKINNQLGILAGA